MEDIADKIKGFIKQRFLGDAQQKLENDDLLFEKGIIDSLGLLELIAFIEKTFDVKIKMSEIEIAKFSSINKIVKLISGKKDKTA